MIFYITVLRALAVMLITNSHYTGVYPTDSIANGGLLGDVIFFAVSGFCLVNIKEGFLTWYRRRIIRIYPIVWIITLVYILLGFYKIETLTMVDYFIYPTYYHFVASIIILYIPFYFVMKVKVMTDNTPQIMVGLFIIQTLIYIFIYDKSNYHIDTVEESMIRFLFFQCMLLGVYFRQYKERFINKNKRLNWVILVMLFVFYFGSKLAFVKSEMLSPYQIINQIILFTLLYFVLRCFAGIDSKLEALPIKIKSAISFIAEITLEIYVVQYMIIPRLAFLVFPVNWAVITGTIIVSAFALHVVAGKVIAAIEIIIKKPIP